MSSMLPAGALLYLEAKDFGALLADWNGLAEKRDWLASANDEALIFALRTFSVPRKDVANTIRHLVSCVPPDYALLTSVAGFELRHRTCTIVRSLEFLYVGGRVLRAREGRPRPFGKRAAHIDFHAPLR